MIRGIPGLLASGITWLLLALALLWASGALWFDLPVFFIPRGVVAGLFLAGTLATAVLVRPVWRAKLGIGLAVLAVLGWWLSLKPRQDRDWKTEVSRCARIDIEGDQVTIHNLRNFAYRTETDSTPHWETRRYDLRQLRAADIFITYWGSPYIAHPIISFDFGAAGHVCFSIETRPEKDEDYSALGGLYRQFELTCVVADERDVIRLRTNFRGSEDVYLYRLRVSALKESFLGYARTVNELAASPRWYNAITNNCTTAIRHQRAPGERMPLDWRILVNGYGDQLLYENNRINRSLPFAELRQRAHINSQAKAAGQDPDFSARIRAGVPGID